MVSYLLHLAMKMIFVIFYIIGFEELLKEIHGLPKMKITLRNNMVYNFRYFRISLMIARALGWSMVKYTFIENYHAIVKCHFTNAEIIL